jgi:3-hydroxyacyl-[acyl-carrier-protein] dehydratase
MLGAFMRLETFQMVDRIAVLNPGAGIVQAECLVPEQSPVFEGHFPGYPILPGVLMIEAMAQTGGWLLIVLQQFTRMALLAQVRHAKLRAMVSPGAHLRAESRLVHDGSGYAVMSARLESDGRGLAEAELTYRVVPFPTPSLREHVLGAARRAQMPEKYLHAA